MMLEQFIRLLEDKEYRQTLKQVITIVENYEAEREKVMESEEDLMYLRNLVRKKEEENTRLLMDKKSLEMDKKALTQFIIDEVQDDKKLALIFNF